MISPDRRSRRSADITEADKLEDPAEQANVKAAVDTVVVTTEAGMPGEEEVARDQRVRRSTSAATDYLVPDFYEIGGGNIFSQVEIELNGQFPLLHVSLHDAEVRGGEHLPGRPGAR